MARQVLRGSTALFVAQVVANGASFLMSWAVARALGDSAYGQFAAAYALATSVAALADSGIRMALIREVARQMDQWRPLMRRALMVSALLALLVSFGFLLVSAIRESWQAQALRTWLLLFALLWTEMRILLGVPAGRHLLPAVAWWGAAERLGGALLVGGMAFAGAELTALAQGLCAWELAVIALLVWWMRQQRWPTARAGAPGSLPGFVRMAIPFGIAATVHAVLGRLDLIVLGYRQPPSLIGDYAAAQMLAMIAVFAGVSVSNALFPALSTLSSDRDVQAARKLLAPALGLTATGMLLLGAVLAWIGEDLLRVVYGPTFVEGSPWLIWYALASPLSVVGAMTGAVIGAWGWQGAWAKALIWMLALFAPAFWLLGGEYGAWGVAVANVAVQVVMAWVAWRWMSDEGLVAEAWLTRLLATLAAMEGFMLLAPSTWHWTGVLLAAGLAAALRLFRWEWMGDVWRLAR